MRTVASGERPALEIVHTPDNGWMVADGINDPNVEGACVVMHMTHVVEQNPSLAAQATLPPGFMATREHVFAPWVISPFEWAPEE